jgi:hypothetical protein
VMMYSRIAQDHMWGFDGNANCQTIGLNND